MSQSSGAPYLSANTWEEHHLIGCRLASCVTGRGCLDILSRELEFRVTGAGLD